MGSDRRGTEAQPSVLIAASSMHRSRAKVSGLARRVLGYFPRLKQRAGAKAGYLSGGEQQMLAIGRDDGAEAASAG